MKRIIWCLSFVVVLQFGCSRFHEQSGQIFVVTSGRQNLKMGLVGVHVVNEEQLNAIAQPLLKRFQYATEKYKARSAQLSKDCDRLGQFGMELQSLVPSGLKIGAIDLLGTRVFERRDRLRAQDRRDLADPLLAADALGEQLVATLPPAVCKTDADGKFAVKVAPGDWVIASDQRTLLGGEVENYLWIAHVTEERSPILLSNDSLVNDRALIEFLDQRSGLSFSPQEPSIPDVSKETEDWIKVVKEEALAARVKAAAEELETAKRRYDWTLGPVRADLLEKWGGDEWHRLQFEVASFDKVEDLMTRAARFNKAADDLNVILERAVSREAADNALAREKADASAKEAAAKAQADKQAAEDEAEKAKKGAELEKLRSTPQFQGTANIVGSQFRAFDFGFGFWAESTFGGAQLRIYLNGRVPKSGFSGSDADVSINIDNRLKGTEEYSSNGHSFRIEWDRPSRFSWKPVVAVLWVNLNRLPNT